MRIVTCFRCGQDRLHHAHGYCSTCYAALTRLAGLPVRHGPPPLVCTCDTPYPILLPVWQDYECGRCGRAIR